MEFKKDRTRKRMAPIQHPLIDKKELDRIALKVFGFHACKHDKVYSERACGLCEEKYKKKYDKLAYTGKMLSVEARLLRNKAEVLKAFRAILMLEIDINSMLDWHEDLFLAGQGEFRQS